MLGDGSHDVLTCPGPTRANRREGRPLGSHRVLVWATLDLVRNVIYGIGTKDRVFVLSGDLDDILDGWRDLIDMKRGRGRAQSVYARWRAIPESPEES